jgi:hypothetical protein
MATHAQRIADLEAEVRTLRDQVQAVLAAGLMVEFAFRAGREFESDEKYRAAAEASQPRPRLRHLRALPEGGR